MPRDSVDIFGNTSLLIAHFTVSLTLKEHLCDSYQYKELQTQLRSVVKEINPEILGSGTHVLKLTTEFHQLDLNWKRQMPTCC